jgi:hypothetical protein
MKDPGPDRTARSELDDLRASAVKIGSARVNEYSALKLPDSRPSVNYRT